MNPILNAQSSIHTRSVGMHGARVCAQKVSLLLDLQIDKELVLAVEGTDRLDRALLAVVLGPNLVVGVLGQLPETVITLVVGDEAFHRERVSILQVHDSALQTSVRVVGYLPLHDALHRAALLRHGI